MNIRTVPYTVPYQVTGRFARVDKRPGPKPLKLIAFSQVARSGRLDIVNPNEISRHIIPYLEINYIDSLAEQSEQFKMHKNAANELAKKQLEQFENSETKLAIEKRINNSGIEGVEIPKGPFHNYLHQYRALIAFIDALPNAIEVLKENEIKDINAKDYYGKTQLHWAAIKGQTDIAQYLIDAGAEVNAPSNNGTTPLHLAACNGRTDIAKALIKAGADVKAPNNNGTTPLHGAARNGHTDISKVLIDFGAEVNKQDRWKNIPLHWAARNGHTDMAKVLISAPRADVNVQDDDGMSPLHWGARNAHKEVVEALIEGGADVDVKDNAGRTPLDWAIRYDRTGVVKILRAKTS